jgi:hypothetical protein
MVYTENYLCYIEEIFHVITLSHISIYSIYSLKMQPFSLFHTVVSTLHVSATHSHPQVRLR